MHHGRFRLDLLRADDLRATSHTRLKACDHCGLRSHVVEKAKTVRARFILEGKCLRAQRDFHRCKVYMNLYMECYE